MVERMNPLLSPDLLAQSRKAQVANILKKQQAGRTLTAREERTLLEASTEVPPTENFVRTFDELCRHLGCSRQTIYNVMKRRADCPQPRADGRHNVADWLKFFIDNAIAKTDPEGADEDKPVTVADWKARELQLKCQKLEIETMKILGKLVDANAVEAGISVIMGAARQALNNLPGSLAQKMLHLTDFHEAEEIVQGAVDTVLRTLERCEFFAEDGPTAPPVEDEEDDDDSDLDDEPLSITKRATKQAKKRGRSRR
jgi:predicted DNA-binding transcriptional regulator AlpA